MRDLQKYAEECIHELDSLGIKYGKIKEFKINSRAISRLGNCKKTGGTYTIEISSILLDERVDLKKGLKNTLMHEILHTCYGCMNHGKRWTSYAQKVNLAYGYLVKTTTSEIDIQIPDDLKSEPKYLVKCQKCGMEYRRHKISGLIKNPSKYRCGNCKGFLLRVR